MVANLNSMFFGLETFLESPSGVLVSFKAIPIDIVMDSGEELQQILLSTKLLIIYKYSQAGTPVHIVIY